MSELKKKEQKLENKLAQLRQLISSSQYEQSGHYTGLKRPYESISPPNKQQKMGGEYSVADVAADHEYVAILTFNMPTSHYIAQKGLQNEVKLERADNFCDENYDFWTAELTEEAPIGFVDTKSWLGWKKSFTPVELFKVENFSFCFYSFPQPGKRIKEKVFLPFMHWVLQVHISEEIGAQVMEKLCNVYLDPKNTKFACTQVISIVKKILRTCKRNGGTFAYTPQKLGLLVVFLFHIFSAFSAFGAPVEIEEEEMPVFRAIIQYLYEYQRTLGQIYPALRANSSTISPIQFVVQNLNPVTCTEELKGRIKAILNPIPAYARTPRQSGKNLAKSKRRTLE